MRTDPPKEVKQASKHNLKETLAIGVCFTVTFFFVIKILFL